MFRRRLIVSVKAQMTDAQAVAAAKAALAIGYATGDSASSVTQNLTLPLTGSSGCTISWASSDQALASTARAADKTAITIGYGPGDSASSVRGNVVLPTSGSNGSSITWSSSKPDAISISGGVTSPSDDDANVTLTADFPLTVKALLLSSWLHSTAISPGNGAIEVDPGIVIGIPFQRPLDPTTVNDTTFQLLKTSDSQNIPINVAYDSGSQTVSLAPHSPLDEATQYSIVVASTLKDSDEADLPSPMDFNFTTLSYEDILSQWKFKWRRQRFIRQGQPVQQLLRYL